MRARVMKMRNDKWSLSVERLLALTFVSVISVAAQHGPALADSEAASESGGVWSSGGESESGGVFGQGAYSESGGVGSAGQSESGGVWGQGAYSESGGVGSAGYSESGGIYGQGFESESGGPVGFGMNVGRIPYRASWLWTHAHRQANPAPVYTHVPHMEVKNYTWPSPVAAPQQPVTQTQGAMVASAADAARKRPVLGGKHINTARGQAVTAF